MKIESWPLERLTPYANNPRINDNAVDAVVASIREFGFRVPIVVDDDGTIVAGHTRLKAARKLGLDKVPVHVAKELTDAQIKAFRLADNRTAQNSLWDDEALAAEIQRLQELDFDLELTAFDADEITRLLDSTAAPAELNDPDIVPEPPADPVSELGVIYELGEHRLLCGDSTDAKQVRQLMNGERAILFATDPPYLVNYDGTNHPGKSKQVEKEKNKDWSDSYAITWDDADANPDLYDHFVGVAIAEAIDPNAAWYCWHASRRQAMVEGVWQKHGAFVHQQIIWAKDRGILTRSWYLWGHEPCFMGWIKGNKPPRISDDYPRTVWEIPTIKVGEKTDHPTSKPIEVFAIPMRQHTKVGELCYEPFAGSGSQIIAAESLNRRCYAIEISPAYVDVCRRRWAEYVHGEGCDWQTLTPEAGRLT